MSDAESAQKADLSAHYEVVSVRDGVGTESSRSASSFRIRYGERCPLRVRDGVRGLVEWKRGVDIY